MKGFISSKHLKILAGEDDDDEYDEYDDDDDDFNDDDSYDNEDDDSYDGDDRDVDALCLYDCFLSCICIF